MRAHRSHFVLLCGVVSFMAAGLVVYSQTIAFAWDEGFHLLTAQLIKGGKTPWIDFCFPQTPLNAYWNAGWMRFFGDSWRVVHAIAALLTAGAVFLTADFILERFPPARWRLAGALAAALLAGMNTMVVEYGTIGQAYGLCLFLIVAGFRVTVSAVDRRTPLLPLAAGLLAGAAAASSLLTAPVAPILLIWAVVCNRAGNRVAKAAAFLVGVTAAFVPVFLLFAEGPRQALFNVIQYHLLYRQVEWAGAIHHDMEIMVSWIDSPTALILGLLAVAGLLFVAAKSDWDRSARAEFYLCGWLALALCIHISSAHPTFSRYYLLAVPFLAILAVAGLYWINSRLSSPDHTVWAVLLLGFLLSLAMGKAVYDKREDFSWRDFEKIARKIDEVTASQSTVLADEQVYFLTRRAPPSGMELEDSHKLKLPAAEAALLHIVSQPELKKRIDSGAFSTLETCGDDDKIQEIDSKHIYAHKAEIADCAVFWGKGSAQLLK